MSSSPQAENRERDSFSVLSSIDVDQLWKFQLRREHAAVLEQLNSLTVIVKNSESFNQKVLERVNAIESSNTKLLQDFKEIAEQASKVRTELEEIRKNRETARGNTGENFDKDPSPPDNSSRSDTAPITAPSPIRDAAPITTEPVHSIPDSRKKAANTVSRTRAERVATRKSQRRAKPAPESTSPEIPSLLQGGASFSSYLQHANDLAFDVSPRQHSQFLSSFLSGLSIPDIRLTIISAFQRDGVRITVKEDEQMDFDCSWKDAFNIIRRAVAIRPDPLPKRQKRMLVRPEDLAAGVRM